MPLSETKEIPGRSLAGFFRQSPFFLLFLLLAGGVLFSAFFPLPSAAGLWLVTAGLAVVLVLQSPALRGNLLMGSIFVLGWALGSEAMPGEDIPRGERIVFTATVTDRVETSGRWHRTRARLEAYRLTEGDSTWKPTGEKVLLWVDTLSCVEMGDEISAIGYLNPVDTSGGRSGYARTMLSRGITGRVFVTHGRVISMKQGRPGGIFEAARLASLRVQEGLSLRLESLGMSPREEALVLALFAGDRRMVDRDLREEYSKAGTSHILAVSGLHLGILFLVSNFFLAPMVLLRGGRALRTAAVILLLWGFAFVSGLSASVLRSASMFTLLQFSLGKASRGNSWNSLFASAFLLTLVRPSMLFDPSFQFSYVAVAGILFFYPRLRRWTGTAGLERILRLRIKRSGRWPTAGYAIVYGVFSFTASCLLVGLAAQLAVAPLAAALFGRAPLLNVLVNPAAVLLVTVLMAAGLLWLSVSTLFSCSLPVEIVDLPARWLNELVRFTSEFRWASVETLRFDGKLLLLVYLLFLAGAIGIKLREERSNGPQKWE